MTGRVAKRLKSSTSGHYWEIKEGTIGTRERGTMFSLDCYILLSWFALVVIFLARMLICTQSWIGKIGY